jgi:hypothetical protein
MKAQGVGRRVAVVLVAAAWLELAGNGIAEPAGPRVVVLLHDEARVPLDVVTRARAEVQRLYGLIGVEIEWAAAVPAGNQRLRVVSLVSWEPPFKMAPEPALGVSPGGPARPGRIAYVFVPRVERAAQRFSVSIYNLLAAAIAHELGHMLLPNGWHASNGLMAATWNPDHCRSASAGLLHFTPQTAAVIRRGLIEEVGISARKESR